MWNLVAQEQFSEASTWALVYERALDLPAIKKKRLLVQYPSCKTREKRISLLGSD